MPSRCPNVGAADEVGPLESAAQKAELKSTWDVALSMAKRFGHFLDREAVSGFEMSETESDFNREKVSWNAPQLGCLGCLLAQRRGFTPCSR